MFARKIIPWYEKNKRDLPWRHTQDPYFIWLSEIILQQTRVAQGLPYYNTFIDKFKSVKALATASESDVLRTWQGLGYYSRARNLHFTAKFVFEHLNGVFPNNYKDLKKLKGIGSYTAAAIASFAFNEAVPAIDGNAMRVFARVFEYKNAIDDPKAQKYFFELGLNLLQNTDPSTFNQAVMELGATVCTPKNPNCLQCPLMNICLAFTNKSQTQYPFKLKKTKIINRFLNYFVFYTNNGVWLKLRDKKDIWSNLYDFYSEEGEFFNFENAFQKIQSDFKSNEFILLDIKEVNHVLSHQRLTVKFYRIKLKKQNLSTKFGKFYTIEEIENIPKPVVIDNYLKTLEL